MTREHTARVLIALVLGLLGACRAPGEPAEPAQPPNAAEGRALALAAAPPPSAADVMRVHFIDVGQGDATLLEFPCAAVLIDTGGEFTDTFESTPELEQYLLDFFDRRADLGGVLTSLIITHPHIDHTRGCRLVRDQFFPQNLVTNGQTGSSGGAQQRMMHRYAADSEGMASPVGFRAVRLDDIPLDGLTDGVIDPVDCAALGIDPELRVLWGQLTTNPGWTAGHFDDSNNHSIVLRVDYGDASLLFTGDLEEDAIEELVARYDGNGLLDADVYQVGHHGSVNGTTDELVAAISPELAVCSMGPEDRDGTFCALAFGHPRREVIDMLQTGIVRQRTPLATRVGIRSRQFEDREITQAVYATGWDGDVVLEAHLDGTIAVVSPEESASHLININTASAAELEELPAIGPVKAAAIVEDREANGPFGSVDDLDRVHGIGPATVEVVRHFVVAGP